MKPDFFTSEDIVSLTPCARLFYIGLWCEADREGRLAWRPGTFKLRYFPGDNVDIESIGNELIERRLVVLYAEGLAYIPKFLQHQHINPREPASVLPSPPVDNSRVSDASTTREHRVSDAQGGRKEGREGKGMEDASATRPVDNSSTSKPVNGAWWKTHEGIRAKGEELGIPPQRGEGFPEYSNRLFDHINTKKTAPKSKFQDADA